MSLVDLIDALRQSVSLHLGKVVFSVPAIIVGYALYKVVARETRRLKEQKRLEEHVAYSLTRIVQWAAVAGILLAILAQFGVTIAAISGLFTLVGGTTKHVKRPPLKYLRHQ